ncbi:MAG: esterase-like activity of phytase family protein [Planctomycetota bacterium]
MRTCLPHVLLAVILNLGIASAWAEPTLVGFFRLPADTFAQGPTSGQFIEAANGRTPPFADRQPVQGVSCVIHSPEGLLLLSDNGFGGKSNSADYLLSVYRLPSGPEILGMHPPEPAFTIHDPDRQIPWPIVADAEFYPNGKGDIPVDPAIREQRLLTGADFDVESFVRLDDGSFIIGEEFGPYLLHVDATGKLLRAPIPVPGVKSPDNPTLAKDEAPTLPRSRGFEGMAKLPNAPHLLCMLEGPVQGQPEKQLNVYRFDYEQMGFAPNDPISPAFTYHLSDEASAIGELTALNDRHLIVIERDSKQGDEAAWKKLFLVDIERQDADGNASKTRLADLLAIADPKDLDGNGDPIHRMPFWTIESVLVVDPRTLLIVNDNNYPFAHGRQEGLPEPTEFALIRFERPVESHVP